MRGSAKGDAERAVANGSLGRDSKVLFAEYARVWVERHPLRDSTREDYRRDLENWVIPHLGEKRTLAQIQPVDVHRFVDHLRAAESARGARLATTSIRSILNPLRAALATAEREGLIDRSPVTRLRVAEPKRIEDDDETVGVKAFTRAELAMFLAVVPERHRLLFTLMASTGLRIGEALGLEWRHLQLDGSAPHVRVRQGLSRGRIEPPKTRAGRRDVPLDGDLVLELRRYRDASERAGDRDLVFPSAAGTPLSYHNLRRAIRPVLEEIGCGWASFHAFRHTFVSLAIDGGVTNVVLLARWLGHSSPKVTLDTYSHWLERDELGTPLNLSAALATAQTPVQTDATETDRGTGVVT